MDAASFIVDRRIVEGTRSNYRGKLNTIIAFIGQAHPQLLDDDGSFDIPLPRQVIEELFGWLSTNTDLPKQRGRGQAEQEDDPEDHDEPDQFAQRKVTISPSTMQGYKSALLWHYAGANVQMDSGDEQWIDSFIQGYKKVIADKKSKGVMPIMEGKSPISFAGFCVIAKIMACMTPDRRRFTWAESIFSWPYMVTLITNRRVAHLNIFSAFFGTSCVDAQR